MRRSALGLVCVCALAGCGMVTGLSNDYKFVPDDAAAGGDGGSDGASGGDGQADAANACGAGAFTCATPTCLANCCDEGAACWDSATCKQYAECRRGCAVRNSECLGRCESNAPSEARDLFDKVNSCLPSGCKNPCGFN